MLSQDRKQSVLDCRDSGVPTGEGSTKKQRTDGAERHCALQDVFGQATPQEMNDWLGSVEPHERRTIIWVAGQVLGADGFLTIVKGTVRAEHEGDIAKALAPVQQELEAAKSAAVNTGASRDEHKRNAERLAGEVVALEEAATTHAGALQGWSEKADELRDQRDDAWDKNKDLGDEVVRLQAKLYRQQEQFDAHLQSEGQ